MSVGLYLFDFHSFFLFFLCLISSMLDHIYRAACVIPNAIAHIHGKFPAHCLSATSYIWRSCYSPRVYLSKNVTLRTLVHRVDARATLPKKQQQQPNKCIVCSFNRSLVRSLTRTPFFCHTLNIIFLFFNCCKSYLYKYLIWFLNSSSTSENTCIQTLHGRRVMQWCKKHTHTFACRHIECEKLFAHQRCTLFAHTNGAEQNDGNSRKKWNIQ